MRLGVLHRRSSAREERQDSRHLRNQNEDAARSNFLHVRAMSCRKTPLEGKTLTGQPRETNMQGLLLDVIQEAAPEAYAKRTKREGIVNAWMDENFAQAVRGTGEWPIREHLP
jgi:hypothetical protein